MNKRLSEIVIAISLASALSGCATTKNSYATERERVTDPIEQIYLKQDNRAVQLRGSSEYKSNTINGAINGYAIFKKEGSTGFTPTPNKTPTPVPLEGL